MRKEWVARKKVDFVNHVLLTRDQEVKKLSRDVECANESIEIQQPKQRADCRRKSSWKGKKDLY